MKTCENCGNEHEGTYGSGRFCSTKCSRCFSTKAKRAEINEKVSNKIIANAKKIKSNCLYCGKEFERSWYKRNQLTCSRTCGAKHKWKNEDYRNNISDINSKIAKERHAEKPGTFGWNTRLKLQPSYPESIAINVLNSEGILYEREMPFYQYYIDFAILSKKIAIEIDGQQHSKPERMLSDKKKDELLISEGWTVFRIKWPTDNIIKSIKSIIAML